MLDAIPSAFNLAGPLLNKATPNIYVDSQLMDLGTLVKNLKLDHDLSDKKEIAAPVHMTDVRNQTAEIIITDELFEASQASIEWVLDGKETQAASNLYTKLEIDESYDLWVYALINTIHGLEIGTRSALTVEYDSIPDPVFTGNRRIIDISLRVNHDE